MKLNNPLKEDGYEENSTAIIACLVCINQRLCLLQTVAQLPGQNAGRPIGKMDVGQKLSTGTQAIAYTMSNALQSFSGNYTSAACCS
jgi:hypothetical protein